MLLASPHRTLDPETADFFFVPVYGGCYISRFFRPTPAHSLFVRDQWLPAPVLGNQFYRRALAWIQAHLPYRARTLTVTLALALSLSRSLSLSLSLSLTRRTCRTGRAAAVPTTSSPSRTTRARASHRSSCATPSCSPRGGGTRCNP